MYGRDVCVSSGLGLARPRCERRRVKCRKESSDMRARERGGATRRMHRVDAHNGVHRTMMTDESQSESPGACHLVCMLVGRVCVL